MNKKHVLVLGLLFLLAACTQEQDPLKQSPHASPEDKIESRRWYTQEQVYLGEKVYKQNCIACHLENATGTKEWKKTLPDGSYPPPPLNGSAHAWHHSIEVLLNVINQGGVPFGGKMPAFREKLTDAEKLAVISYFQSFWSDDIYEKWTQINVAN